MKRRTLLKALVAAPLAVVVIVVPTATIPTASAESTVIRKWKRGLTPTDGRWHTIQYTDSGKISNHAVHANHDFSIGLDQAWGGKLPKDMTELDQLAAQIARASR